MPMPGSQRWNVVGFAHFLNAWKWPIRMVLYLLTIMSVMPTFRRYKILTSICLLVVAAVTYFFNFPMTASNMFRPIKVKKFASVKDNKILPEKLVIGVTYGNESRAYPIEMIGYHHRVLDTISGKSVFVTYCTVCRTGRVFEPVVNGKQEEFQLVGMDHFNAMFEDKTTGTWWRQENGEACAGRLKGQKLPEFPSVQMTLREWLQLHPDGKVLQWDSNFTDKYKRMSKFDKGNSGSKLTGSDTGSWKEKSWVLGIQGKNKAYVYDWNKLKKSRWIVDTLDGKTLLIFMHKDNMSYSAYFVKESIGQFKNSYYFEGNEHVEAKDGILYFSTGKVASVNPAMVLQYQAENAPVYQEFWHSWRTFHPSSIRRFVKE